MMKGKLMKAIEDLVKRMGIVFFLFAPLFVGLFAFSHPAHAWQLWTSKGTEEVVRTNLEGFRNTYSFGVRMPTASMVAAATDMIVMRGTAGKVMRITRVQVSGDVSAATSIDLFLVKRWTPSTGGASAVIPGNAAIYDPSNITPTSAVFYTYTSNPTTLGTGGYLRIDEYPLSPDVNGYPAQPLIWDFGVRNSGMPILRSASDTIALNFGGNSAPAGLALYLDIEWTEDVQ
jgi:hypothetical protein